MAFKVTMPKLGMIEGDLSVIEWKVKEGDNVEKGQVLCVVEGQKITNDVEAEVAGVVRGIYLSAGKPSKIGTVIAIIADAGEDISSMIPAGDAAPSPAASPAGGSAAAASEGDDGGPKASPSAKALAMEKHVKLHNVASALGISRRITVFDVEEYLENFKALEPKCKESKLTGMRRVIASRMMSSSHGTAPVTIMRTVDITALKKSRDAKKAELAGTGNSVPSYNDFLIKACALALKEHPAVNATYEDETLCVWENINITMAVAVPAGLTVPVIRDVDKKTIYEINAAAKELAKKADENKLTGDELAGGTFCVTNLGMMDVEY
ncbi:MAG: 2-oxo acid dehydrogenase subunit E2, partial [Clostridia bacterium]|nr:2-oxo acid dehydrogenase subunit E2 [Clostridia bacterium]